MGTCVKRGSTIAFTPLTEFSLLRVDLVASATIMLLKKSLAFICFCLVRATSMDLTSLDQLNLNSPISKGHYAPLLLRRMKPQKLLLLKSRKKKLEQKKFNSRKSNFKSQHSVLAFSATKPPEQRK